MTAVKKSFWPHCKSFKKSLNLNGNFALHKICMYCSQEKILLKFRFIGRKKFPFTFYHIEWCMILILWNYLKFAIWEDLLKPIEIA